LAHYQPGTYGCSVSRATDFYIEVFNFCQSKQINYWLTEKTSRVSEANHHLSCGMRSIHYLRSGVLRLHGGSKMLHFMRKEEL
ncbi:MAG: hypothetical protein P8077_03135, partial [Gammaproteobacteria bacterium]